jgi:hypothetical protein
MLLMTVDLFAQLRRRRLADLLVTLAKHAELRPIMAFRAAPLSTPEAGGLPGGSNDDAARPAGRC